MNKTCEASQKPSQNNAETRSPGKTRKPIGFADPNSCDADFHHPAKRTPVKTEFQVNGPFANDQVIPENPAFHGRLHVGGFIRSTCLGRQICFHACSGCQRLSLRQNLVDGAALVPQRLRNLLKIDSDPPAISHHWLGASHHWLPA